MTTALDSNENDVSMNSTLIDNSILTSDVTFNIEENVILKLTKDKFIFKGIELEDAGEAHKAFIETMHNMKNSGKCKEPSEYNIDFMVERDVILTLTKDKFIFKGIEIEDASEAHKVFIETMHMFNSTKLY